MNQPEPPPNLREPKGWQRYCTQKLLDASGLPDNQRASAWSEARKKLIKLARDQFSDPRQQRIIIADAQLKNQCLKDFDFSYCYIVRTDLRSADLQDSKFNYAIIRDCFFNDVNANGANFGMADIKDTYVEDLHYDSRTKLNFARFEASGLVAPQLQDRINQDRLAASNRNASVFNKFLNFATAYGFGIGRVLLACAAIILAFAVVYCAIGPEGFAIGAGTSKPESLTYWNFLLFSAERFLNASPWIYGVSSLTHFLTVLETLVGLFGLGILVAMLIRRVLRSN